MQEEKSNNTELDLIDLLLVIWSYKKLILAATGCAALLAALYLKFVVAPVYLATATVELGAFLKAEQKHTIENPDTLTQELESKFIATQSHQQVKVAELKLNTAKTAITIVAESKDAQLALQKVDEVVKFIEARHQKLFDLKVVELKKDFEVIEKKVSTTKKDHLHRIDAKISLLKDKEAVLLKDRIESLQAQISKLKGFSSDKDAIFKMAELEEKLFEAQLRKESIFKEDIPELEEVRQKLLNEDVAKIESEKTKIEKSLDQENLEMSKLVGQIDTMPKPARPNKFVVLFSIVAGTAMLLMMGVVFWDLAVKPNLGKFRK